MGENPELIAMAARIADRLCDQQHIGKGGSTWQAINAGARAALTPSPCPGDGMREALAKRTSMSTVAGGGKRPHVEIRFANLADAHALTDAVLGRTPAGNDKIETSMTVQEAWAANKKLVNSPTAVEDADGLLYEPECSETEKEREAYRLGYDHAMSGFPALVGPGIDAALTPSALSGDNSQSSSNAGGVDEQALKDLAELPDLLAGHVRYHIREMYPAVLDAAPSTFLLSVGNSVRNRLDIEITGFLASLSTPTAEPTPTPDRIGKDAMIERLRIMAKQRTSSQMDEDEREGADWQGAYDWFCDESRAIYAALTDTKGDRPMGDR